MENIKWQVDAIKDANGYYTIRPYDGTIHGDTEPNPIATVYTEANARLIASTHRQPRNTTVVSESGVVSARDVAIEAIGLLDEKFDRTDVSKIAKWIKFLSTQA